MKIFVTNLDTSTDRRKHISAELLKTGLEFEFVKCVVGAELIDKEIQQEFDVPLINSYNEKVVWFTKGIMGCTLTNKKTYRRIVDEDIAYALLLEDDIVLPADLKDLLIYIESFIQQGDVILLSSLANRWTLLRKCGIKDFGKFSFYFADDIKYVHGGCAFIVTKQAAEKMLIANTPIQITPDDWPFFFSKNCINRLIIVKPEVVENAQFRTTMGTGSFTKLIDIIERFRIFPFYQILRYKRKKSTYHRQQFIFSK